MKFPYELIITADFCVCVLWKAIAIIGNQRVKDLLMSKETLHQMSILSDIYITYNLNGVWVQNEEIIKTFSKYAGLDYKLLKFY
jgi:hypothetical protein